jgi:hypothetical protein
VTTRRPLKVVSVLPSKVPDVPNWQPMPIGDALVHTMTVSSTCFICQSPEFRSIVSTIDWLIEISWVPTSGSPTRYEYARSYVVLRTPLPDRVIA